MLHQRYTPLQKKLLKIAFGLLMLSSMRVFSEGNNLAWTEHAETIHPALVEHSLKMEQKIYEVIPGMIYVAVGYGIANATMVIGDDGIIIIDTLETKEAAQEVLAEFRVITDKPIKAIIYTHNHLDHIGGVCGFVSKEEVARGDVEIISQETLLDEVTNVASVVGAMLGDRGA